MTVKNTDPLTDVEVSFCETFEAQLEQQNILRVMGDCLTSKGREALKETTEFVDKNIDKYLSLTGK